MLNPLDVEIKITLEIIDVNSPYTIMYVYVPHLEKTLEIKVPNDIQEGYKLRFTGLGRDIQTGYKGDLYIIINRIIIVKDETQKVLVVNNNDFSSVNEYLSQGWKVKEFLPFKDLVYVIIEMHR